MAQTLLQNWRNFAISLYTNCDGFHPSALNFTNTKGSETDAKCIVSRFTI